MRRSFLDAPATRRDVLAAGVGLGSLLLANPAHATAEEMEAAIQGFAGEARIRPGKVSLDVSPLVENGNSVSLVVKVDSAMTVNDFVRRIAIFNEKNPQPNVAVFQLSPRSGRAQVSTRIRLATSQRVTAIAELGDGSFWSDTADVIVTIAACTEEL